MVLEFTNKYLLLGKFSKMPIFGPVWALKGEQKKRVHPKFDSTSNRNNFGTVCPIYLKFNVHWVPIGDSTHINFQVNWTNCSKVIADGSWVQFWVDSFFFAHPLLLRETLVFSAVLTNCEAWYNLTTTDISELEYIDKLYLRNILQVTTSSPVIVKLPCMQYRDHGYRRDPDHRYHRRHCVPSQRHHGSLQGN